MPTFQARLTCAGLALLSLVALLAGCGRRWVAIDSSKLELRLDEYRIIPDAVRVHAGRLKIVAYNTGLLPHDVAVELDHRDAHGGAIVIGRTSTARPGQQVTMKVTLAPGSYKLVDTISNHEDLGQYATLQAR